MSTRKNYTIRKNANLPTAGRSLGQFCPFKEMEIGDSFAFASADQKRVESLADAYGKKNGAAFFINIADECLCFRTA